MIRLLATAFVLAAPQVAVAETSPCLTREELTTFIAFALPPVIDAAAKKCAPVLGPDAYMNEGARRLAQRFRSEGESAAARVPQVVDKMIGEEDVADLSAETKTALLRDLLGASAVEDLKPDDCSAVEELVRAVEPMSAANIGSLFGALMTLTGRRDEKNPLRVCPPSRR